MTCLNISLALAIVISAVLCSYTYQYITDFDSFATSFGSDPEIARCMTFSGLGTNSLMAMGYSQGIMSYAGIVACIGGLVKPGYTPAWDFDVVCNHTNIGPFGGNSFHTYQYLMMYGMPSEACFRSNVVISRPGSCLTCEALVVEEEEGEQAETSDDMVRIYPHHLRKTSGDISTQVKTRGAALVISESFSDVPWCSQESMIGVGPTDSPLYGIESYLVCGWGHRRDRRHGYADIYDYTNGRETDDSDIPGYKYWLMRSGYNTGSYCSVVRDPTIRDLIYDFDVDTVSHTNEVTYTAPDPKTHLYKAKMEINGSVYNYQQNKECMLEVVNEKGVASSGWVTVDGKLCYFDSPKSCLCDDSIPRPPIQIPFVLSDEDVSGLVLDKASMTDLISPMFLYEFSNINTGLVYKSKDEPTPIRRPVYYLKDGVEVKVTEIEDIYEKVAFDGTCE